MFLSMQLTTVSFCAQILNWKLLTMRVSLLVWWCVIVKAKLAGMWGKQYHLLKFEVQFFGMRPLIHDDVESKCLDITPFGQWLCDCCSFNRGNVTYGYNSYSSSWLFGFKSLSACLWPREVFLCRIIFKNYLTQSC